MPFEDVTPSQVTFEDVESTEAPLSEEQLRQQYTTAAQQGVGTKVLGLGEALAGLVLNPLVSFSESVQENPLTAFNTFNPIARTATTLEAGRRTGLGLNEMLANRLRSITQGVVENPVQSLLSPSSIAVRQGGQDLLSAAKQLVPYTPGEAELDQAVRDAILAREVEGEKQRTPQFLLDLGARPTEAKFIEEVAPFLVGGPTAKAAIPPVIGSRAAILGEQAALAAERAKASPVIQKMTSRGILEAPLEDVVTKTIGITAQEGSLELLPVLKTRVLQATKKAPTNAKEALQAANEAGKFVIDKTLATLKQAGDEGLGMSKSDIVSNMEMRLKEALPRITQEEMDAVINPLVRKFPDKIDPLAGQKDLVSANDVLSGPHEATGIAKRKIRGNADITANLALAESLSNQLDDIYKAVSKLDESPYRDWGKIQEFKSGLEGEIISSQRVQGGAAGRGLKTLPTSKFALAGAIAKTLARPFIPRAIEAVDRGVKRIFNEAPDLPPPATLDPALQQSLLEKYSRIATPAVTPALSSTAIREAQIQALIASYPENIRRSPRVREIAEMDLAGETTPVP